MTSEPNPRTIKVDSGSLVAEIWFIGWLFTFAFAKLIWWQALIAVAIWPWYLGVAALK